MHDKNLNGSIDLDECVSLLYQRFGKDPVDAAMTKVGPSEASDEKSVTFSTYVQILTEADKSSKPSFTKADGQWKMVPTVKGATLVSQDPALAHLV